jgi:HK97 gp10 family phage protein
MTITGLDAFLSGLRNAPEYVRTKATQAVSASTFSTERSVRSGAPVDTGTLARAIHSRTSALSGQVLIRAEAYYWRFVEYGTTRGTSLGGRVTTTAARPFIRQAAEVEQPIFERRMLDVANDVTQFVTSGSRFL